ncbi:MAG: DUF2163 domain-containing protein [Tsuneonella suprasediminis]|uniref:DUF2163 domain-containing protein n=1 Tax=Tsuneonella suprasediminis TaxID=2306996 RepID=A0A419QYI9_9SPHN|nr:DUF2163 domain-containing protein [Tsuneonella suprasediminis]RJX65662.1 DUF2163 domain-containing protein [Tsuneonella suprasediminis]UBS33511.1 DUF2163 domain-containing protein [Altererythrobacter sp. N1]
MSRAFFTRELECVATFWRIYRRDGVALGFTGHDRDLTFDGIRHRAAPGMLPSAIQRTAALTGDSAAMQGALAHDAISATDLAAGRFDGARVEAGAVDWESGESMVLYSGTIGSVSQDGAAFSADLLSAKAVLDRDVVPRTSPTCRAAFCGPQCGLSAARFTHEARVDRVDFAANAVTFSGALPASDAMLCGTVRWIDGPQAGLAMEVVAAGEAGLTLATPLDLALSPGTAAVLIEGCDGRLATCHQRFANARNFRGEPFLPGNDLLTRHAVPL